MLERNKVLAEQYFSVAVNFSYGDREIPPANNRIIRIKIENSEIDITDFYQRKGNLNGLKIRGIGVQTIAFLEMILEKGYDESLRIAEERKKKRLQAIVSS